MGMYTYLLYNVYISEQMRTIIIADIKSTVVTPATIIMTSRLPPPTKIIVNAK